MAILDQSGAIPSIVMVAAIAAFLRGVRDSMWKLALLSLPGTMAHELSHLVVGALVLAKPQRFSLWPRRHGGRWVLGFVTFGNVNALNGAFVALAPLLLLPLAVLALIHLLLPLWNAHEWAWWFLAGYVTATFLLASLPSMQDLAMGARSLMFYVLVTVAVLAAWHFV